VKQKGKTYRWFAITAERMRKKKNKKKKKKFALK
jgi:hypothetical protein